LDFRIARHKEAGHVRIFVLGESAVRGTPEPGFGFAALLQAQLRTAYPGKAIDVFNLGIVAINSHVVYQMAKEAADLEPDLFVVYMGNNEVVGPYGPGSANLPAMPPLWVIRASIWTRQFRIGQFARRLVGWLGKSTPGSLEWHGMSTFSEQTVRGDDPRLEAVYRSFEANLGDIVEAARHAGVKTVLATVVSNLRDCPPFSSLHRAGLSEQDLRRWQSDYSEGKRLWELDEREGAIRSLNDALKIDPGYADAHFILGKSLEATGDLAAARTQYLEAQHWDGLHFRPDSRINSVVRNVAAEHSGDVLLLDSALAFGSDPASSGPPCGREALLEHVHFNWEGNRRMARMLAEKASSALFGAGSSHGEWLDAQGCARAVGYTEFGHLRVLEKMEPIRGKAPFTGQLTFGEDQARYQHEVSVAQAEATSTGALASERRQLEGALSLDPGNPSLLQRLIELESESGNAESVLSLGDRLLALVPRSPELLVQHARALAKLHRDKEAQEQVLDALRIDPHNLPTYTAFVDILRGSGDFESGRRVFSGALARDPGNAFIRLSYADLLFFHGNRDDAVRECKAVLGREPENVDALRRLVSLNTAEGNKDEAMALMVEARRTQPFNYENDLALAQAYEAKGDIDRAVDCLRAAAASGPATAQAHLYIARYLDKKGQKADALLELHRARRVADVTGEQRLSLEISETIREEQKD
jgi:tetratricopeptide (TPR) repeat protein